MGFDRDIVMMDGTRDGLAAALIGDAPAYVAWRDALGAGGVYLPPIDRCTSTSDDRLASSAGTVP